MSKRAGWRIAVLLSLAAFALAVAGCGKEDVAAPEPAAAGNESASKNATQVEAQLGVASNGEYTFTLDRSSAPAGDVVFNIENAGELVHEFELVKTDVAADKLPARADNKDKADVEAGGGEEMGEVEDIEPGAKKEFGLVDLEPGKYLIVCNLPGHYGHGMVIPFTVK